MAAAAPPEVPLRRAPSITGAAKASYAPSLLKGSRVCTTIFCSTPATAANSLRMSPPAALNTMVLGAAARPGRSVRSNGDPLMCAPPSVTFST